MESINFSIIVPIYNTEKYLKQCIESIVNQTYKNFELILVDDGSTDSSGEICDKYNEKYDFIKVIHQKNKGVSSARNVGIDISQNDWICFVDSDDWINPNMLSILRKNIAKEKADLYSFNAWKISERDNVFESLIFYKENDVICFETEIQKFNYYYDLLMQYWVGWEVWQRVFRRDIILKEHLMFVSRDDVFAEDFLFTFQYMLHVKKIGVICNLLYNYCQRENSLICTEDKKSVLLKLYNFAVMGYKSVIKYNMFYFFKNYHKLYFML